MKRTWKRILIGFPLLATLLISPNLLDGCGPFFDEAIFSFRTHPDAPLESFLSGKLGVIEPSYRYRFLFAAYRQLAGVPLDKDEKAAVVELDGLVTGRPDPRFEASKSPAIAQWIEARAKVMPGDQPKIDPTVTRDYATWNNCQADAFRNAARTLDDRIGKVGAQSPDMREWVQGQDTVFANCGQNANALPPAISAKAASWLRADRDYQIAAAEFYAGKYDDAAQEFRKIAADRNSPWSVMAPYLAARCVLRKAMHDVTDRESGGPDKAALAQAEGMLKSILADPAQRPMHSAAQGLLGFVEFRLHPDERGEELAALLMKPHGGEHFRQDLQDYTLLLDVIEPDDEMSDWIRTVSRSAEKRSLEYSPHPVPGLKELQKHALDKWHETKSLPWLVASLMLEPAGSPASAELLAAADKIPEGAPAYLTAQYHSARLLAQSGRLEEARAKLNTLEAQRKLAGLTRGEMPPSAANLFQQQRARVAPTFAAFIKEAQLKAVGTQAGDSGNEDTDIPKEGGGIYFDDYSVEVLNKRTSIAHLQEAVKPGVLAPSLRRKLAVAAWVRASLLDDVTAADALSSTVSEVEPPLANDMQKYRTATGDAKHFQAVWIVLRNPGMRPYVRPGLENRDEPLAEMDGLRDNWWCPDVGARFAVQHKQPDAPPCEPRRGNTFFEACPQFVDPDPEFPFPAWASATDPKAATEEWTKLSKVGAAPKYLGDQALAWAQQHPDDLRIAEALGQVVRATHLGCTTTETTAVSKAAFDLLHQRYPQSEWAKKTKYYY